MIKLIFLVSIIILIFCAWIYGWLYEKKHYNKGVCPDCGGDLVHSPYLDDSQGGIGFKCEKCNYCTWTTWFNPLLKKKKRNVKRSNRVV